MTESLYSASSKHVKELVAFGKKCSRTAFPNPEREGCPGLASLRAMASRDERLSIDDLLISHVVRCSPCFHEYTRLRQMSLLMSGLRITAFALVAVVISVTAIRFLQNHYNRQSALSLSEQRRSPPQPSISIPQVPSARIPVTIDLAPFSPTRGTEEDDSKKAIHLAQGPLRVTLRMPFGMEPGAYAIQLKDSAGKVYADSRVEGSISGGRTTLHVDFDLTILPRSLNLMIRPPGLTWRTYAVIVE